MVVPICFLISFHYFGNQNAGPSSDFFTIKLHHGGHFKKGANNVYCGANRKVSYFDYCETDKLSMIELSIIVDDLRLQKVYYSGMLQFFMLRWDGTLSEIINDSDVLRLASGVNKDGEVELYLDVQSSIKVVTPEKMKPTGKNPTCSY